MKDETNMADIIDVDPLTRYMAMFVGANGSGKSIAIGSWKAKGSIYYFDLDGRMASVANWYKQRGLKAGQLSYDTYGPGNFMSLFDKLEDFIDRCDHAAIVIDSFTSFTISAVMFCLRSRERKGGAAMAKRSKGDMVIPDWDEWNSEAAAVTRALDLCKAIVANGTDVIWTAHPVSSTKIEGSKYSVQTKYAAYGHKSESLVPIYFNEIYHFVTDHSLDSDDVARICITKPIAGVNAKTALNIPAKIEWTDKDFYQIFSKLVREGQEEANRKGEQYLIDNPEETPKTSNFQL